MGLLSGFVMVAAGAVCLGGAVISRHWLGTAAATVMLAAMVDSAYFGLVSSVVWVGTLVLAGMLLGFRLRPARATVSKHAHGAARSSPVAPCLAPPTLQHAWLPRAVMVAAALAYPATAWLVLSHHSHATGVTGSTVAPSHHSTATLTGVLPVGIILALTTALVWFGLLAVFHRRPFLATEAGGMSAMLLAMLAGHG